MGFLLSSFVTIAGQVMGLGPTSLGMTLLIPVTFLALVLIPLAFFALVSWRIPSRQDLALKRGISIREAVVIAVVFVVSHGLFWLFSFAGEQPANQTTQFFDEMGLAGPLLPAAVQMISVVILAPVCEELLYRGMILRPVHDSLIRCDAPRSAAAVISILVATLAFALPHIGDETTTAEILGYFVTGIAFGMVYVITGSMTAVMVSHSLQSCLVMAQVLLFGNGGQAVNPVLYVLAIGCPVFVYLSARALHAAFPAARTEERTGGVPQRG